MKKIGFLLLLTLILSTTTFAYTNQAQYEDYALKLKEIDVFKGSDKGFELERKTTRLEAAILFVRLLGAEKTAKEMKYPHPFTDVPNWGDSYVGYLYNEGLTKGVNAITFGSDLDVRGNDYMTFILRALGYDDSIGDFSWQTSADFALEKGLINANDYEEIHNKLWIIRDVIAKFSYLTLNIQMKNSDITLLEHLIQTGAIDDNVDINLSDDSWYLEDKRIQIRANTFFCSLDQIYNLVDEDEIKVLQSFPYSGGEPRYGGFEHYKKAIGPANDIIEDFNNIEPSILKPNQILLTSNYLVYRAGNNNFMIRGILVEKLEDGTRVEQYVEFAYKPYKYNPDTGIFTFVFEGMKVLQ